MEKIVIAHQDALMYMYLMIAAGARQALFCSQNLLAGLARECERGHATIGC